MSPPKDQPQNCGLVIDAAAARLCLLSALLWSAENGVSTGLSIRDWLTLVRDLSPREIVVIAFHTIRGMTHEEVGAWLEVSRGRTDQHRRTAVEKLKATAGEILQRGD